MAHGGDVHDGYGSGTFGSATEEGEKEKRKRERRKQEQAAHSEISRARSDEERLRGAVLSRLKGREESLETQRGEMMQDLHAEQGRAATAAYGRRAGQSSGGGKLSVLSGIGIDTARAGREIHRKQDELVHEAALNRLGFERESLKDVEALRGETVSFQDDAKELIKANKTWGYINETSLASAVDNHVRVNGLSEIEATKLRNAVDELVDQDSALPFL